MEIPHLSQLKPLGENTWDEVSLGVLIRNGNELESDVKQFFGTENVYWCDLGEFDFHDIIVKAGVATSKSECRRCDIPNEIPEGYSVMKPFKRRNTTFEMLRPAPSRELPPTPTFDMESLRVAVLGLGQIGKAVMDCYRLKGKTPLVRDIDRDELTEADVLHVCIPGDLPDFKEIVLKAVKDAGGGCLAIIHSTVPLGTTEGIFERHKLVCHVPVRGVHSDVKGEGLCEKGILHFVNFCGGDFAGAVRLGCEVMGWLGADAIPVYRSRNTEAAKLWDTTAYGWNIVLEKEIHRYCEENGLNFGVVYSQFTESYNSGYLALNRPEVVRPVLKHMPGPIDRPAEGKKGHCITANTRLLNHRVGDLIDRWNKDYEG